MEPTMAVVVAAVAGTKLYIGDTNTVPSPDTYIEVGNVRSMTAVASNYTKIAVESIGDAYTRQIKGTQMSPAFDIVCNRDDDDTGQVALKAAQLVRNTLYNFKVLETDGGLTYFKGRVFSTAPTYGGVNDLKTLSVQIEVEPDSIDFTVGS
jgi:hypothetical protein